MKNFTAVLPDVQKKLGITQLQTTVTGNNFDFSQVNPNGKFFERPLFVDNCNTCNNNNMKNADGYGSYGVAPVSGTYGGYSGTVAPVSGTYGGGGKSGAGFSWNNALNQVGNLANSYFQNQSSQNASEIAQANAEAERLRAERERIANAGKKLENEGAIDKIKAYIVPISIVGGLVIVGIATYFIFKKKKIQ